MEFSNREIAISIWIFIILFYCFLHKSLRSAFKTLIKTIFSRQIISCLIIIYGLLFILINYLFKWNIWDFSLLKDTLIWGITVPLVALMKATTSNNSNYFKNTFKETFELIILVEFLGLSYPFQLIIELTIIPLVLLFALGGDVARRQDATKNVATFFDIVVAIIGIFAFYHSVKLAIVDYQKLFSLQTIKEIVFTPILSLLYLPLTFFFTLYAKYELLFLRLSNKKYLTKKEQRSKRWNVFRECKFNLKKIESYKIV